MPAFEEFRYVVVGSGFFGAVYAERIAAVLGEPVLVLERRSHIGGNAYSEVDEATGIEYHRYGSHLFHTSNRAVWDYIGKFTEFTNYRHRVFTRHNDKTYTMPINLMTLNNFFGVDLRPDQAQAFIAEKAAHDACEAPGNLEEKALSLVGRDLYEAFIRGYTAKQWETDPRLLPANIITRLPVRMNFNDFYFNDTFEGLPIDGYHPVFERMLSHERIEVVTECDYFAVRDRIRADALTVYTGPVDRYFDFRFGPLSWRTLDFTIERHAVDDYQGTSVVNYPDLAAPFTRIHEFKHLHPERTHARGRTLIMKEYSRFAGEGDEPYYPVDTPHDKEIYQRYAGLTREERNVVFGGRLGTYRYLDMHQAIAAALKSFERDCLPRVQ